MNHVLRYIVLELSSSGGCPLEDASEQKWIPSIKESLYNVTIPQGFSLYSWFLYSWMHFIILKLRIYKFYILLFNTSGIRALSWVKSGGFYLFIVFQWKIGL